MSDSYIPRSDDALVIWFNKFAAGLAANVGKCGITAEDVTETQKDAAAVESAVNLQALVQAWGESFTAFKDGVIDGLPKGSPTTPLVTPAPLVFPGTLPTAVSPGAVRRAQKRAGRIKDAPDFDEVIGEALGIIAPEKVKERPEDMQPDLTSRGFNAGHPVLRCSRGQADLVEVEGDHADAKGWVHVATTRRAQFTDMFQLPAGGAAQVWRYRAIFRDASGRVGQWSEVVSVTVTGA